MLRRDQLAAAFGDHGDQRVQGSGPAQVIFSVAQRPLAFLDSYMTEQEGHQRSAQLTGNSRVGVGNSEVLVAVEPGSVNPLPQTRRVAQALGLSVAGGPGVDEAQNQVRR